MSTISSGTTSTTTLIHSGDTTGSLVFKTNDTGSGGTTAMTIDTSQNVGIGITSPTDKLDVASTSRWRPRVTNAYTLQINTNAAGSSYADAWHDASTHLWQISGAEKMRIDTSGNVGIGTSSPGAKLEATTNVTGDVIRVSNGTQSLNLGVNNGSGGSYLFENNANALRFGTSNTERMRIDSSGNVGIGTSSPSYKLQVAPSGSGSDQLAVFNDSSTWTSNGGTVLANYYAQTTLIGGIKTSSATPTSGYLTFHTGGTTERMRIDTSGNLLVGTTNSSLTAGAGFKYISDANNPYIGIVNVNSTSAANNYHLYSTNAGAYRFYVSLAGTVNATSTSISAISDETLKQNIRDLETGLPEVMALKPRRFDWKNGDAQNVAGFIAQEVEQVLPELVSDYLYNKDEDGNEIIKKALKMGDILPTLVKAIQELKAINDQQAQTITALTARIEALEK